MNQKGKHQELTTLMRTVKESIEQTLHDAANLDEVADDASAQSDLHGNTVTQVKKISQRMVYCKNAMRILQSDMQTTWVSRFNFNSDRLTKKT